MKYLILIFLFILISVIGGVSAGSLPPIDNAMKTCYFNSNNSAFGESYGNWSNNMTYDYSNNHLNGTIIGGMIWNATDGRLGNGSFTFDGVNDYISNPYIQVNYSNNWTINLWLKRHGNETLKGFFQRDFGVLTYFAKNGKIIIEYTNVSNGYKGTSGNLFYVPFDEWHMLTYDIYNNGTATFMKLYYDGKQNFTQTITSEGLYDANIALE